MELGVIQIAISENETMTIQVPEHVEAAYQIFLDVTLSDFERFIQMLDVLGVSTIRFRKKLRNIEIRREYINILDSIRGNGGQQPKKTLIRHRLCQKHGLKIRQLIKILKN